MVALKFTVAKKIESYERRPKNRNFEKLQTKRKLRFFVLNYNYCNCINVLSLSTYQNL